METRTPYLIACAAALCGALSVSPVFAGVTDQADYYSIGAESISVTETVPAAEAALERPAGTPSTYKQAVTATALINAGIGAWNVISNGAPAAQASSSYASAIPAQLFQNWNALAKWKGPKEYLYTYKVANRMGIDVIRLQYKISFYYTGTSSRGTAPAGSYIANFTVQPVSINVKWGWNFDLAAGMSHPMNIGTHSEPVAFLQADLRWRVSTLLNSTGTVGIWSYTLDGRGNFKDLTAEQKHLTGNITASDTLPGASSASWH